MFYSLIITTTTALFVMQLEQLKQIVRDSCTCIIMYLNVITKKCFNCVSVVSAMSLLRLVLLLLLPPKMNESRKTALSKKSRNNAGISIISTTSR